MPGASWKTMCHDNAVAQGYSDPSPPSVQALLACQGFCTRVIVGGYHVVLPYRFTGGLSMLPEKRTCEY